MSFELSSLWGDEFTIDNTEKDKAALKKAASPKKVKTVDQTIKSKSTDLETKIELITKEVHRILGHYEEDTLVIKDMETFTKYIDSAISNGVIAIDTETNNSLDPLTCKIMGLCIYTPGQKNAYVPVNHINRHTGEKLDWQITESQIKEQLERVKNINCIFHNGKFDYMVIYYTCGIKLPICWDTMIGAQLLNENESAGLKFQYRDKIDNTQEKYSIEHLFEKINYEVFDPELFALYAATDAKMTYELYLYQKAEFEKPGNERLYTLFKDIEMPVVTVVTEMEMRGVSIDKPLAKRMSEKFHKRLDETEANITIEMEKYKDKIAKWRMTDKANFKPIVNGRTQKSLAEKLSDPVELTSATQLGILLYDILGVLKTKSDGKKVVDEATLLKLDLPLPKLILKKREYEKYLGTYIDKLPEVANPRDGRIHAHFNQMGREDRSVVTGRMSSSDPNLQNIPARGDIQSVRCMFIPNTEFPVIESSNDTFEVPIENEVLMADGSYRWSSELKPGDIVDGDRKVIDIKVEDNKIFITL